MGENREQEEAFVTLATNDTYTLGCLVLGNSLRRVGTTRKLVVMITDGVTHSMREQLSALFDEVVVVNVLDSADTCNLNLLGRPDLSVTFTKLHCWRQTQYKKCVFMDADTLVLQNVDNLFDREELSAAPDAGWPDCFNSGVFVFCPSEQTYVSLLQLAVSSGSFDGGDQGLLNLYFSSWATADIGKHLPFTYNVVSQAFYSYLPAFKQFKDQIKIVHFIGAVKPWHHPYNMDKRTVTPLPETGHNQQFLQIWWDIFMDSVHPCLDPHLSVMATPISGHSTTNINDQNYLLNLVASNIPQLSNNSRVPLSPEHGMVYQHRDQQQHHPHHHHHNHQHSNNHNHHHQDKHHGLGHSYSQSKPTTSYAIVYPYTPPNLDDKNDENSRDEKNHKVRSTSIDNNDDGNDQSCLNVSEPSKVVEIPVVYRDYDTVETHYPDEPLSNLDPDFHPVMHEIQNNNPLTVSTSSESVSNPGGHNNKDAEHREKENSEEKEGGSLNDIKSNESENVEVDKGEEDGDVDQGGLIGDLAKMKMSEGAQRDDRQRRLQWEHGQADYLGVDRFDNIKARLDAKINDTGTPIDIVGEGDNTSKVSPDLNLNYRADTDAAEVGKGDCGDQSGGVDVNLSSTTGQEEQQKVVGDSNATGSVEDGIVVDPASLVYSTGQVDVHDSLSPSAASSASSQTDPALVSSISHSRDTPSHDENLSLVDAGVIGEADSQPGQAVDPMRSTANDDKSSILPLQQASPDDSISQSQPAETDCDEFLPPPPLDLLTEEAVSADKAEGENTPTCKLTGDVLPPSEQVTEDTQHVKTEADVPPSNEPEVVALPPNETVSEGQLPPKQPLNEATKPGEQEFESQSKLEAPPPNEPGTKATPPAKSVNETPTVAPVSCEQEVKVEEKVKSQSPPAIPPKPSSQTYPQIPPKPAIKDVAGEKSKLKSPTPPSSAVPKPANKDGKASTNIAPDTSKFESLGPPPATAPKLSKAATTPEAKPASTPSVAPKPSGKDTSDTSAIPKKTTVTQAKPTTAVPAPLSTVPKPFSSIPKSFSKVNPPTSATSAPVTAPASVPSSPTSTLSKSSPVTTATTKPEPAPKPSTTKTPEPPKPSSFITAQSGKFKPTTTPSTSTTSSEMPVSAPKAVTSPGSGPKRQDWPPAPAAAQKPSPSAATTTTATTPTKPSGKLSSLASKFDTSVGGAGASTPSFATSPTSPPPSSSVSSSSSSVKGSNSSPASATNRDEMMKRFGVKLPPPTKK